MDFPVLKRAPDILEGEPAGIVIYDDERQIVAAGATDIEAMEHFLRARDAHLAKFGDLRMWAEITAQEPGLHQVNPVNQRREAVRPPGMGR